LIRSFKTTEQDLVKGIEEKIQNSANRPTEAVEQEIGTISEEPSAASEQLINRTKKLEQIQMWAMSTSKIFL
jgi:hypothetical protein